MISEPFHSYDAYVQRGDTKIWTTGNRVEISWNPQELAADQPVTVEIINCVDGENGIEIHSNITVVSEQPNTGKAEFHLPKMENLR